MRNSVKYIFSLILFLFLIFSIIYGSILRHHYIGGKKFKSLQNIAVFFAEIPSNLKKIIYSKEINRPPPLLKNINKKRFEQFIPNERNALLVLPRYDDDITRSVVDIIDLKNFETIHTYKHDISAMNDKILNIKDFPRLKIDSSPVRFEYGHPLILEDGSLISVYGPAFRIDFCSNLMWVNDKQKFHHSIMKDHEGNIWIGGEVNPKSKYVELFKIKDFKDQSLVKINKDGKIIYNKSVIEILIENKILFKNFALNSYLNNVKTPIHLNDIEPVLKNTKYLKKGDVLLSIRGMSAIVHYRPQTNKVIDYIIGPFAEQHDVDIISDNEISIFNNNNFLVNNENSEIIIYNLDTKKFKNLYKNQLKKENFKTVNNGIHQILNDGSLLVEETIHGRLILLNNKGEKEWEFVNKNKNGNIGRINWSRVIEDKNLIDKIKSHIVNKKC